MGEEYSDNSWQDKISLFLDNRLDPEEMSSFLISMQSNPVIGQWVEKEKQFRDLLKEQFQRPVVTEDFADRVKERCGVL